MARTLPLWHRCPRRPQVTAQTMPETPIAGEALPGRSEPPFEMPERHAVLGTPLQPPFPDGDRGRLLRARLLLGGRAALLGHRRRLHDGGRLHERDDAEPDLRGGLQRQDRPRRGGAGRLRPGQGLLRRPAQGLLRGARPDPGHAPGQRRRHPVPLGDLLHQRRPEGDGGDGARRPTTRRCAPPATSRSRPRSSPPAPFYYAEDYHQQYLHKVPNGYCGLAGTGVSCRIPGAPA